MSHSQKAERGYSTGMLIVASLGFSAVEIFWSIYNSYVPLILEAKLSDLGSIVLPATLISTLVGAIMSIDNVFGLVLQPFFGRRSDRTRSRFGKRLPYLLFGIPFCAIFFALIPCMSGLSGVAGVLALMCAVILFNLGMSVWRAPSVAIMPDFVPAKYQSDGNAVVNMVAVVFSIISSMAATILGLFGFQQAIAEGNYISVFLFGSILALLCLVIITVFVKWPDNRQEVLEETVAETKKSSLRNLDLPREVKSSLLFMMLALFLLSGSSDGFGTFFTLYSTKSLGIGVADATLIRTISYIGAVILAVPAGVMGRKIGRKTTIIIGLVITAASQGLTFLLPYLHLSSYIMPFTVLNFIASGAFILININTLPVMLSIGGKERFGEFTGYYYTATFSAAVVCPALIGFLAGITGTYNTVLLFCFIVMAVAIVCVAKVKHGEGADEAELEEAVKNAED